MRFWDDFSLFLFSPCQPHSFFSGKKITPHLFNFKRFQFNIESENKIILKNTDIKKIN